MCISPNTLNDGTKTACHKCWQCQEQAINDWTGRNIAENKTAVASNAVTLTYGRTEDNQVDHLRAAILTYSDVQKYLKLLRRHGYPVRYFVTGEYGSSKGRAHWHIILHWQEKVPEHELQVRFMERHWPHGVSYWDTAAEAAVRYNCKYILKDMGDDARQGHLAMSKKPPLGAAYFESLADQYVEQGLAPQTLEYTFPTSKRRKKDGRMETIPYRLKDRSAELFLRRYVETWSRQRPHQNIPKSELVERFLVPDADDRRRVLERLEQMGPPSGWTPAQRIQVKYDLARLDHFEWADGKISLLEVKRTRQLNPVIRRGPQDIVDWDYQWERQNLSDKQVKQRQRQQRQVQRRVERVWAEFYARQGRKGYIDAQGSVVYPLDGDGAD